MDAHKEFDINIHIEKWQSEIENVDSLTEGDREELKSHFLDVLDSLKALGLDDEEAFLVTKKRLGNSSDWDEDYQTVNNPLLQMRKSLVVFMGVLLYVLSFGVYCKLALHCTKQVWCRWLYFTCLGCKVSYFCSFHLYFLCCIYLSV